MGRDERLNLFKGAMREAGIPTTGDPIVLDQPGRVLQIDDVILLQLPRAPHFRVMQITPVLDPNAPPGMLTVHVGCMMSFAVKRGTPINEFLRIATAQEAGPSGLTLLEAAPAPAQEQ